VLEDGKPQAIELFAVDGRGAVAATPTSAAAQAAAAEGGTPLPNGEYSNRAVARAGGVTAIVLDRLNTGFEEQKLARDQIVDFLKSVSREDRIALYVLQTGTLQILHEFTRDNASLIAALNRYQARTSRSKQATDARQQDLAKGGTHEDAEFERWLEEKAQQVSAFYIRDRVKLTAAAFETIASHLAGVRGRKNVVWVSSSFPIRIDEPHGAQTFTSELNETAKAINGANIAIYAVDARQMIPPFALAATEPTKEVSGPRRYDADFPKSTFEKDARNVDTLQSIADLTGGRAFSVLGNIGKGIRQAVEDSRLTYVLGYYPVNANWDGTYHDIKVTVNRPGVTVRTRKGYYATRFEAVNPATSEAALLEAIRSPLEATGLGVTARVVKGKAANSVDVTVRPAADAITLTRADGRWTGAIDIVIAQSLPNGQTFKTFAVNAGLDLTDEQHERMLREGLTFDRTVTLRPGSHRLHLIVRDSANGATGSVIVPIADVR
jgi:VWFA-related protein